MNSVSSLIFLATMLTGPLDATELFLQVWDQREVPAPAAGILSEVHVDRGHVVAEGDILAKLDDREQLIARDRALVELAVAQKRLESTKAKIALKRQLLQFASKSLERAADSNHQAIDAVSDAEIEQLQIKKEQTAYDLREAENEIQILEAMAELKTQDLRAAEVALQKRTIKAAIAGEVVDLHVRPGEWIEPGQPLLRIVQLDQLTVETLVPSTAEVDDLLGQDISLAVDMPSHPAVTFRGHVDYVSSEVGAVDGRVRIRIRIANPNNLLRPGFQVRVVTPGIIHAN